MKNDNGMTESSLLFLAAEQQVTNQHQERTACPHNGYARPTHRLPSQGSSESAERAANEITGHVNGIYAVRRFGMARKNDGLIG